MPTVKSRTWRSAVSLALPLALLVPLVDSGQALMLSEGLVPTPLGEDLVNLKVPHVEWTIPQRSEVDLEWEVEILHELGWPLTPIVFELGPPVITGEQADLCQLQGGDSQAGDGSTGSGLPAAGPGAHSEDENNGDDTYDLYPDHYQILQQLGLGTFPQNATPDITIFAESTSETYKKPYSCNVTVPAVATDGLGNSQKLNLTGLINAIPQPDFNIPIGVCQIVNNAFPPVTVENTDTGCHATTVANYGLPGGPDQPIVLTGTKPTANLTVGVKYDVTLAEKGHLINDEEFYAIQYYNRDNCNGEGSAVNGYVLRKDHGASTGSIEVLTVLPDTRQSQTKTQICYTAEIWENDPGDRDPNPAADDDDFIDRRQYSVYFRYEWIPVGCEQGEARADAAQNDCGVGLGICDELIQTLLNQMTVAVSDVVDCLLGNPGSQQLTYGPLLKRKASSLMIPIQYRGAPAIFGQSVDPSILDQAQAELFGRIGQPSIGLMTLP